MRYRRRHDVLELVTILCKALEAFEVRWYEVSRTSRVRLGEAMQGSDCVASELHEVRLFEA